MEILKEIQWTRSPEVRALLEPDRKTSVPLLRQTVLERIKIPNCLPKDLAFDGHHLWVADGMPSKVHKIEVATNAVSTIDIPYYSGFGRPTGRLAFDGEYMWVAIEGTQIQLLKVDIATNSVVGSFSGLGELEFVAFDGGYMWATTKSAPYRLNLIDIATNRIEWILDNSFYDSQFGTGPILPIDDMAFDGAWMWIASNRLYRLWRGFFLQAFVDYASKPELLAFDGRSGLWVVSRNPLNLTKIDVNSNTIEFSIDLSQWWWTPSDIVFDGCYLWLSNDSGHVKMFDPTSFTILTRVGMFSASSHREKVKMAFDGTHLWVTHGDREFVSKIPVFPYA